MAEPYGFGEVVPLDAGFGEKSDAVDEYPPGVLVANTFVIGFGLESIGVTGGKFNVN